MSLFVTSGSSSVKIKCGPPRPASTTFTLSGSVSFCNSSITAGPKPSSANRGFPHPATTISGYSMTLLRSLLDEFLGDYLVVLIDYDHVCSARDARVVPAHDNLGEL